MKTLKTILLSLFIAASMGAVSTSALAEVDPGRITYKPAEAIDMVVAKIQAAIEGISKGASNEEAAALIKQASDLSKEINANDKVDNARAKANRKLKSAISHAKESALQEAEAELRDAKKDFEALKSLL
jgi:predicted TIM-barrel fold metal-dependent hydrolase